MTCFGIHCFVLSGLGLGLPLWETICVQFRPLPPMRRRLLSSSFPRYYFPFAWSRRSRGRRSSCETAGGNPRSSERESRQPENCTAEPAIVDGGAEACSSTGEDRLHHSCGVGRM